MDASGTDVALVTNNIGTMIVAAGALGTAAYGVIDGLKTSSFISCFGFGHLRRQLDRFSPVFRAAYGDDYAEVLALYYAKDRASEAFMADLRQNVRLGLSALKEEGIREIEDVLQGRSPEHIALLTNVREALAAGEDPERQAQIDFARLEALVMSRLDAGAAAAENAFKGKMKLSATVAALALSFLGLSVLVCAGEMVLSGASIGLALMVGIVAVPIAPVAKDVASGLNAAMKALRARV